MRTVRPQDRKRVVSELVNRMADEGLPHDRIADVLGMRLAEVRRIRRGGPPDLVTERAWRLCIRYAREQGQTREGLRGEPLLPMCLVAPVDYNDSGCGVKWCLGTRDEACGGYVRECRGCAAFAGNREGSETG